MNNMIKTALASSFLAAAVVALPLSASAQMASSQMAYPDKCKSEMSSGGDMSMQGHQMSGMAEFQKESMDGMKSMNMNMMQGMMKKDPDVAFACGMIAHHMGAISMAQVELKYGKNAETKAKAQKIIDDQTKEIKELTAWVEKEAK
ncbi:DUF305 domain-containing protein [Rhizobium sp. YJ-22]|uniref:DUF305 domain-containing protein n=1 Tax=Rhizobium sp. YJ-22 TaxID=3037556 RepID=UPI002412A0D3|nr:DUF305 domain-containing protein [Rhizobium sp. YJ-22]MDG3576936.1 DUF305 domain-containing protein [Rhizobium sp. YJ-22]